MIGTDVTEIPRALTSYPSLPNQGLGAELSARMQLEPYNAIATGIFALAILHTFSAGRFTALAHRVQQKHDRNARALQRSPGPSVVAELLHFMGEIEVVFGLWAVVLIVVTYRIGDWNQPPTTSTRP